MPLAATIALLKQLPLLSGLSETELAPLAQQSRPDHFEPDATIFNQADPADRVWLIRTGRVKIVRQEESGREIILEVLSPGEVFGGATLFMPKHPATARAMTACATISFSSDIYAGFLTQHPQVALKLIRMLGGRLHATMNLRVLTGEKVERRLAHILLKLADRAGRPDPEGILITIPLSRQDLADMSGTTLETTIRTMSRFRGDGLLQTRRGGYLLIMDEAKLRELAHDPE
jgi:CRP-like cAMP-binding protein